MAGQGVNLGLGDVRALAQVLKEASETGQDIGSFHVLQEYARRAELRAMPVMIGVDVLWKLFNIDFGPLNIVRSAGVQLLDTVPLLKNFMINRASNNNSN